MAEGFGQGIAEAFRFFFFCAVGACVVCLFIGWVVWHYWL